MGKLSLEKFVIDYRFTNTCELDNFNVSFSKNPTPSKIPLKANNPLDRNLGTIMLPFALKDYPNNLYILIEQEGGKRKQFVYEMCRTTGSITKIKKGRHEHFKYKNEIYPTNEREFWYGGLNPNEELFVSKLDQTYISYFHENLEKFVEEYWNHH